MSLAFYIQGNQLDNSCSEKGDCYGCQGVKAKHSAEHIHSKSAEKTQQDHQPSRRIEWQRKNKNEINHRRNHAPQTDFVKNNHL